ncbi:hypothetical protein P8S54_08805 [Thiomicrospira sp. R3]|uniref:hypothetical protein n=1 Tax=Thiomicrospira sp. R3 TaxID=3035472 RepID=UPI00259AF667|nr:hypothetical protein [Thiomicrospira sp. R3]WFE68308.1 hypothetical protein P8S54_08805 [Thiomicrospira sp. R3]
MALSHWAYPSVQNGKDDLQAAVIVALSAKVLEEAAKSFKERGHYLTWRDAVADMMASSRQGHRYQGLFPKSP